MKAMIVCVSKSHGNTKRIADVMGQVLDARVVAPGRVDPTELASCDLVGFGSGVHLRAVYRQLHQFIGSLPPPRRPTKAFAFATSGFPESGYQRFLRPVVADLEHKGFEVVDTFSCRGYDTFWPLKVVGGVNKGHPDAADLSAAGSFAEELRRRVGA